MAETITTPSGLQYTDEVVGDGPSPKTGQTVTVHYTGTFEDGKQVRLVPRPEPAVQLRHRHAAASSRAGTRAS